MDTQNRGDQLEPERRVPPRHFGERRPGESFFDLSTPLSKEAFRRHFDETRRGKKPARVKVRFEQQGVPTQFIVTQTPFLGGDDAVRGTILLMQEAAELVEARK
jgi:hypothetical protein